VKTQTVRLLDVGLVGPLMVWGGAKAIEEKPLAGILLTLLGLATVSYNAVNYGKVARRRGRASWPLLVAAAVPP